MTLEDQLERLGGCGDGGCIISPPKGMHTNGGCKCNRIPHKMSAAIHYLRKEVERLREFMES